MSLLTACRPITLLGRLHSRQRWGKAIKGLKLSISIGIRRFLFFSLFPLPRPGSLLLLSHPCCFLLLLSHHSLSVDFPLFLYSFLLSSLLFLFLKFFFYHSFLLSLSLFLLLLSLLFLLSGSCCYLLSSLSLSFFPMFSLQFLPIKLPFLFDRFLSFYLLLLFFLFNFASPFLHQHSLSFHLLFPSF